jgi:hypothetical protein
MNIRPTTTGITQAPHTAAYTGDQALPRTVLTPHTPTQASGHSTQTEGEPANALGITLLYLEHQQAHHTQVTNAAPTDGYHLHLVTQSPHLNTHIQNVTDIPPGTLYIQPTNPPPLGRPATPQQHQQAHTQQQVGLGIQYHQPQPSAFGHPVHIIPVPRTGHAPLAAGTAPPTSNLPFDTYTAMIQFMHAQTLALSNVRGNLASMQANHTTDISTAEVLERLMDRGNLQTNRTSTKSTKFEELSATVKLVLRRMCTVDIFAEEPTEAAPTCLALINSANKAQQTNYINLLLKAKGALGRWSTGHVSKFTTIGPLWQESDDHSGLTMFGVYCTGRPDISATKSLQLTLQGTIDEKYDKDDIWLLTKQDLHPPQSEHEQRIVFNTFEQLLSILCTEGAILPQVMKGWIHHLDE